MPGPKPSVTVTFTAAELAEVDAARGTSRRETWVRAAALASARAHAERAKAGPAPDVCPPHPARRVLRGLCNACGRAVGDEKTA